MIGQSLNKIIDSTSKLKQIFKEELRFGDQIYLHTRNSVYSIYVLNEKTYLVSGGWFDKKDLSPFKTTISGCTWGGKIIKTDIIAACGLCLEFGNRVITSPIKKISVNRFWQQN
jgi:hypothetical protein